MNEFGDFVKERTEKYYIPRLKKKMLNHNKCILDYPSKFKGERSKQVRYFRELIKLIGGRYKKSSMYVSEIVPKSNEDHIVDEKDIKDGVF